MLYLETTPNTFQVWRGERINGISYPLSIERKWTSEELSALDLYKPEAPDPVPEGKVSVSVIVERIEGTVKFVHTLEDAPPPAVPDEVPSREARLVLNQAGLRDSIETLIANADQNTKDYWEYSLTFGRNHPVLLSLAAQLELSDEQVDDLFMQAGNL